MRFKMERCEWMPLIEDHIRQHSVKLPCCRTLVVSRHGCNTLCGDLLVRDFVGLMGAAAGVEKHSATSRYAAKAAKKSVCGKLSL